MRYASCQPRSDRCGSRRPRQLPKIRVRPAASPTSTLAAGASEPRDASTDLVLQVSSDAAVARAARVIEPVGRVESGLYYRIPVRAAVSLIVVKGSDPNRETRMLATVPQFGAVVSLPGDADMKSTCRPQRKARPGGGLISLANPRAARYGSARRRRWNWSEDSIGCDSRQNSQ